MKHTICGLALSSLTSALTLLPDSDSAADPQNIVHAKWFAGDDCSGEVYSYDMIPEPSLLDYIKDRTDEISLFPELSCDNDGERICHRIESVWSDDFSVSTYCSKQVPSNVTEAVSDNLASSVKRWALVAGINNTFI